MAPFDASFDDPLPERGMPPGDAVVRDLGFLAEHYLRNQRPVESFALLSFLAEVGIGDLRLKKMFLIAAVEIHKTAVARRLIEELLVLQESLSEEEREILYYYRQKVIVLEGAAQ